MFAEPTLLALASLGGIVGLTARDDRNLLFLAVYLARLEYSIANLAFVVLFDLPAVHGHSEVPVLITPEKHMQRVAVGLNAVNYPGTSGNTCRLLCLAAEYECRTSKNYK